MNDLNKIVESLKDFKKLDLYPHDDSGKYYDIKEIANNQDMTIRITATGMNEEIVIHLKRGD